MANWLEVLPLLVAFSLLSSAGYLFNDVRNREEDRHHPRKCRRPVAARRIPPGNALLAMVMLAAAGGGLLVANYGFGGRMGGATWSGLGYLGLTIAYSLILRSIPYVDIFALGLGFVLRVTAGAFALGVIPTFWLIAITYSLSLLLGFGKRLGELLLMQRRNLEKGETRSALQGYQMETLRTMVGGAAFVVGGLYVLYCLIERDNRVPFLFTAIPVITGISAYLRMAWRTDTVEAPEQLLFSSRVLLSSVVVWLLMVLVLG